MADWQHRAYTLRYGTLLGEVKMSSWEVPGGEMNGARQWQGNVIIGGLDGTPPALVSQLDRGRVAIVSTRDGLAVNFGIIWRSVYRPGSGLLELAGAGLWSYMDARLIPTLSFTSVAQNDLVSFLLADANLKYGINLEAGANKAGAARTREWIIQDAKRLGEALAELVAVRGGPDIIARPLIDQGGVVRRLVTVWSPRAGRKLDEEESPRFEVGINAFDAAIETDGTTIANYAVAVGEGEGAAAIFEEATDTTTLDTTDTPRLDAYIDARTVRLAQTLQDRADGYIDKHRTDRIEPMTVTVMPDHPKAPWTSWQLGDDAYLIVDHDDPLMPGAIIERRITGSTWQVNDEGAEALTVELGPIQLDPTEP